MFHSQEVVTLKLQAWELNKKGDIATRIIHVDRELYRDDFQEEVACIYHKDMSRLVYSEEAVNETFRDAV